MTMIRMEARIKSRSILLIARTIARSSTCFMTLCAVLAFGFAATASAQFEFDDAALTKCINQLAAKKGWQSPQEVTEVICHKKGITSAEGLDKFPNLEKLSLYKNKIEQIDLSQLPKLRHINLAGNNLSSMVIREKPELELLYAFHNPLQTLVIQACPRLKTVKANNGRMVELTLIQTPQLEKLYLFDNQLEIIDIEKSAKLRYLDVRHNPMPDEFYDYLDGLAGLTSLHDGNAEDWQ